MYLMNRDESRSMLGVYPLRSVRRHIQFEQFERSAPLMSRNEWADQNRYLVDGLQ